VAYAVNGRSLWCGQLVSLRIFHCGFCSYVSFNDISTHTRICGQKVGQKDRELTDTYSPLDKISKLPMAHSILEIIRRIVKKPLVLLLHLFLGQVTYFKAGIVTNKNCDFMKEPKFIKAYNAGMKQHDMPNTDIWRYHINHWAISHAKRLKGDFVECGVYRGSITMSNIVYIDFESVKDRKYYLFDTFCGLDKEFSTKEEYGRWDGLYLDCYKFVVSSFKKYPNVVIVKGIVPISLSQVKIDKVAYLSIDMNAALPEFEALKYFWPKLVRGGIVVLDDYGWPTCEKQKALADVFAESAGIKILSLPNGQGVLIK
jgi:hypothetical protein